MHKEILTKNQADLLFIPQMFNKNFGLVGGAAIALQIGHRHSIDFDLFTNMPFSNFNIKKKISKRVKIKNIFKDEDGHYTFIIDDVRFTFFYYPYKLNFSKKFEDIIKMPDILTLAAMKAFALGRRAKWKDYVDLYFIMKNYYSLAQIAGAAKRIFSQEFKVFTSLQKGMESLVAQREIPSSLAREFRKMKAKVLRNKEQEEKKMNKMFSGFSYFGQIKGQTILASEGSRSGAREFVVTDSMDDPNYAFFYKNGKV
jgi:hypothetical protein